MIIISKFIGHKISILNLDMPNCMHCQSIVCQNSIARILYAKIPLLEFHMPIVLYAEIPIAKIQESLMDKSFAR